jgi:hypothetical protein
MFTSRGYSFMRETGKLWKLFCSIRPSLTVNSWS